MSLAIATSTRSLLTTILFNMPSQRLLPRLRHAMFHLYKQEIFIPPKPLAPPTLGARYSSTLSLSHPSVQKYLQSLSQETTSRETQLTRVTRAITEKQNEIRDLLAMGKENADFRELAEADVVKAKQALDLLENEFFSLVVESDPMDHVSEIVLEVSAGVGGQEAMLFTKELLDMYVNYAEYRNWDYHIIGLDDSELGGTRHGSVSISGRDVYKYLKFEGGVHRVQRVPKTEKSGRIHTSASSVAVLPTPTDIEVVINPQDIKFQTMRASGAGGQHVNKTESAVRITHIPSGIVVECQTERSQIQNKANAMKTLSARLYQQQAEKQASQIRTKRKLQTGLGGRNEKIRTYNYVQDRVTDHRIGLTVYNLKGVMGGYEPLDDIVTKLLDFDVKERLEELFK